MQPIAAPLAPLAPRALLGLVALAAAVAPAAAQTVAYVDADAAGAGDGTSWQDAYTDLQDGIASGAAEVWVAEGVYVPGASGDADASFLLQPGLALLGGFAGVETSAAERDPVAHPTTLSGDLDQDDPAPPVVNGTNAAHVVRALGVGADAVLDGFVVRRGYSTFAGGAGMFVEAASPTVVGCVFEHNTTGFAGAGAVALIDSQATFTDCTFRSNIAHAASGGAVYGIGTSAPTFTDCTFVGNWCTNSTPEATGGALEHRATGVLTVVGCTFEDNDAHPFYPTGDGASLGGGVHVLFGSLVVRDSVFHDNRANSGGGIYSWAPAEIVGCRFTENVVTSYEVAPGISHGDLGGGLMVNGSSPRTTRVVNCTFARNHGGEGAGIAAFGQHTAEVRNSILWANEGTGEDVPVVKGQLTGNVDIAWSCVEGLLTPEVGEDPPDPADYPGSHEDDPLFADLGALDLHLAPGSPCIDAADNGELPGDFVLDLDGLPRVVDDPATPDTGLGGPPTVDMGVYEHPGGDCPGASTYCVAAPNSVGAGAAIGWSGSLSVGANDLVLTVDGAPPLQNGVFYYGSDAAQVPFGDGFRCVEGNTVRLPVVQLDAAGAVAWALDLTAPPVPQGQITAGSTWRFQFWYRDPAAGGSGFNLSDALTAVFCP